MPRVRVMTLDTSDICRNWTHVEWSRFTNMVADVVEAMRCNTWPHPQLLIYFLDVYGVGLRLLALESAAYGSAGEARRPTVEAMPGVCEWTTACNEAISAISFALSGVLKVAAKEISNPMKTDIVDVARAVTNTCLSDNTLRYYSIVATNGPLPPGHERFQWHASVGRVLHAIGIFAIASDSAASKRCPDAAQSIADKLSWMLANAMPPKDGPTLMSTFLAAVDKSLVLEYLTRNCILDSQQFTMGAARVGPSGSAVQASLGTARRPFQQDRRMAEAHANVLSALITFQSCKDHQKEIDMIETSDPPDRALYGPNVQFFLASHFCAQLRAIEAVAGAMQQTKSQNTADSTGAASEDAGSTMYGLSQELLLAPHMRCTEGCADCRYANILSSDGLRMALGNWANQGLQQAPESPCRIIGPVASYKLSLRLANACLLALEGARGDQPGPSRLEAAAPSTSGPAATTAAAPTRARPLTQKELRKAQQSQQHQRQSTQPQAKLAAKQQEAKKQDEVRPSVPKLPEDVISLTVTAMISADRIHRTTTVIRCNRPRSDSGSDDGSDAQHSCRDGGSDSGDADESGSVYGSARGDDFEDSEGDGEDEDDDVSSRRFRPYRGDFAALARPVGWWKCCLRVLQLLPKHSEFLYNSLRRGSVKTLLGIVMWDPWRQIDITGGREAPRAGPKASWRPAQEADMAVALPLGLLPCLGQLLRTPGPVVTRFCRALRGGGGGPELIWMEICRWPQLTPLLLRAEWRQAASMVATMGKLLPSSGVRSTMKAALAAAPLHLRLGGMSDDDWGFGGMPFNGQDVLYPIDLFADVLQAVARLRKAECVAAAAAVATQSGIGDGGEGGDAGLSSAGPSGAPAPAAAASVAASSATQSDDLRLLSLASLILARWLPAMPRTLQQLRDAGPSEYGCAAAAGNLTRFLITWLPLLCQCYRLAAERGDAAAAADWKQLILHDAGAPSILDVHLSLCSKDHREEDTLNAIISLWVVFPAEMARALAPECTRKGVVRRPAHGATGGQAGGQGSVPTGRRTRDGQPSPDPHVHEPRTLLAAVCSALLPGGPLSSAGHLKYMQCLSGALGESKRQSAVTAMLKRLLTPLTVVAQRLQPPHEVLCQGDGLLSCANPHCTTVAPAGCEVDLPHRCGGCGGRMAYCSKACQEAHWRGGHREVCGALRTQREAAAAAVSAAVAGPVSHGELQELRAW